MTMDSHVIRARLSTGEALDARSLSVTLDESWSPYTQASLTIKRPAASLLAMLDPRQTPRVLIEVEQVFGDSDTVSALTLDWTGLTAAGVTALFIGDASRDVSATHYRPWNDFGARAGSSISLDLLVRSRPINHRDDTIELALASDEAALQDFGLVSLTSFTPGITSVRTLVQNVLGRIGAVLETGTADAAIEADASEWLPGVTAWDYLAPLVQKAGLRLWCTEQRKWYLTASDFAEPGQVTLSEGNTITDASDDIDRDGDWCDSVVITYKWTDADEVQHTAYDIAYEPGYTKVLAVEYETAYPGAGAARQVLNRRLALGRTQTVDAVSDYTVRPTQALSLTLPDTDTQVGYVSSVTWQVPDAEMRISSRGLVNVPPTAWAFLPAGQAWTASPVGASWTSESVGA